ncbi:MAG TPA: Gfo/Idh/MocA family oxidoreductase, partial [Planctomycetaceae bacterium]|nr:Gfo/Idh/MocA family oxidoreductase [Planctomycetaceae bacterium]
MATRSNSWQKCDRRTLLKAAACTAAPWIVPSSVLGRNAPSNRIAVGIIGLGTRGIPDMRIFMRNPDVEIRALCDVNTASKGYRNESLVMGREPALKEATEYYASRKGSADFKGIDAYVDFRKIIDRQDIDVVAIVVPDHWHAEMTIMAAESGKDIFCQKPLTLTVEQGKQMIQAVRKHKRILQTGSQWRSHAAVRYMCELVRNGRLGKLRRIYATIALNNKKGPG